MQPEAIYDSRLDVHFKEKSPHERSLTSHECEAITYNQADDYGYDNVPLPHTCRDQEQQQDQESDPKT